VLKAEGIWKRFGGVWALYDVDLEVGEAEIVGLMGPNGAGKSTLIGAISGFVAPTKGRVEFNGNEISGLPPHKVAQIGVVRTFQQTSILNGFSVRDSLLLSLEGASAKGFIARAMSGPYAGDRERIVTEAEALTLELGLDAYRDLPAETLPYGRQRALGIAMALATQPSVILMDEPGAGLTQPERRELGQTISSLPSRGIGVLLVEHDVAMVLKLSDRVLVLDHGRVIAKGTPSEVRSDERVIEAYLGGVD